MNVLLAPFAWLAILAMFALCDVIEWAEWRWIWRDQH